MAIISIGIHMRVTGGRQWCSGKASASRTKDLGFESRGVRILPLGYFHTNGEYWLKT